MRRSMLVIAAVVATGAAVRQSALGQLGLTEATARELVLDEVANGNALGGSGSYTKLVETGRKAYKALPASARGPVTTALFAWAKAYAATPAFKAAYLKIRSEQQPQYRQYDLTVEQEVQKNIQEQMANVEALRKAAASMPPADKAQALAAAKETEAMIRNPAIVNADRAQREEDRAKDKSEVDRITKDWQARYPAEVRAYVALTLRQFLDATAGVDFSAKLVTVIGEGGEGLGFANPDYQKKPWQWIECVQAGREAVDAARAAAEAWFKELGS